MRSQELCARTMTMEDAYQDYASIARTQWWFYFIDLVLILQYRARHFARHT